MSTGGRPGGDRCVLIVEDHELLAQSLRYALLADGLAVELAGDLSYEGVLDAAKARPPAVVLLDLDLGVANGPSLPLVGPLRDLGAAVVIVTGVEDRARLGECLAAGALGIVSKSAPFDDLVAAVTEAFAMRSLMSKPERDDLHAEMRRQQADKERQLRRFAGLTPREGQVLAGLVDGKSADTIARDAFVSIATVRSQIHSVLQKLGVSSQIGAVAAARRAGWEPGAE